MLLYLNIFMLFYSYIHLFLPKSSYKFTKKASPVIYIKYKINENKTKERHIKHTKKKQYKRVGT